MENTKGVLNAVLVLVEKENQNIAPITFELIGIGEKMPPI
jgi:hypothetical protein